MYMREVYRVFDIILETPTDHMSDAIIVAHNHVKYIEGVTVEWLPSVPQNLRLRFEEHVSAQNIMLDIIDKLSALGYK